MFTTPFALSHMLLHELSGFSVHLDRWATSCLRKRIVGVCQWGLIRDCASRSYCSNQTFATGFPVVLPQGRAKHGGYASHPASASRPLNPNLRSPSSELIPLWRSNRNRTQVMHSRFPFLDMESFGSCSEAGAPRAMRGGQRGE
jgi:hypothetical protein